MKCKIEYHTIISKFIRLLNFIRKYQADRFHFLYDQISKLIISIFPTISEMTLNQIREN
jgi:hypothetical protein